MFEIWVWNTFTKEWELEVEKPHSIEYVLGYLGEVLKFGIRRWDFVVHPVDSGPFRFAPQKEVQNNE